MKMNAKIHKEWNTKTLTKDKVSITGFPFALGSSMAWHGTATDPVFI